MLNLEYLSELAQEYSEARSARVKEFDLGGKHFAFNSKPAVMGVINLSPDSWYRESVCLNVASAVQRGKILVAQGADLVDLGAESTLANARRADEVSQKSQLLPVVRELHAAGLLVSVETYLPEVAKACLEAGANVLNLTGPSANATMFRLAVDYRAAVIICYLQGTHVRAVEDFDFGTDPIRLMQAFFTRELETARGAGLDRVILDPGLGFYYRNLQDSALRVKHQMRTFLNTFRLRALGYPICHALPHAFDFFREEVRCAEPFFAVLATLGQTDLFRTHEVPRVRAVLDTLASF
jgi:dihydropteroate synthase